MDDAKYKTGSDFSPFHLLMNRGKDLAGTEIAKRS